MENSKCIVSVAFREPYVTHSKRQEEVIDKTFDGFQIYYRDNLPIKNGNVLGDLIVPTFQKSLYGFKPHAIQRAIDIGYKRIVWFDPSVLPTSDLNDLFKELEQTDMLVVKGDNPIVKMTSPKALEWFGTLQEQLSGINHIGGTFYGFNFNNPKTLEVFNLWKKAEEEGIFGNQDEFMAGHWADESCMALAMFKCGVEQKASKTLTYLNQKEL